MESAEATNYEMECIVLRVIMLIIPTDTSKKTFTVGVLKNKALHIKSYVLRSAGVEDIGS